MLTSFRRIGEIGFLRIGKIEEVVLRIGSVLKAKE